MNSVNLPAVALLCIALGACSREYSPKSSVAAAVQSQPVRMQFTRDFIEMTTHSI